MSTPERIRYQLFLSSPVSERLEALAVKSRVTRSSILQDAVTAWLDRRGANELDERFAHRLNKMTGQLNRLERNLKIALESQALITRMQFVRDAHLPDPDEAMRALGRDRYEGFITQIGRTLSQGQSLLSALDENGGQV